MLSAPDYIQFTAHDWFHHQEERLDSLLYLAEGNFPLDPDVREAGSERLVPAMTSPSITGGLTRSVTVAGETNNRGAGRIGYSPKCEHIQLHLGVTNLSTIPKISELRMLRPY